MHRKADEGVLLGGPATEENEARRRIQRCEMVPHFRDTPLGGLTRKLSLNYTCQTRS
jgi:hypothetical protein